VRTIKPILEDVELASDWSGSNNRWVKELFVYLDDANAMPKKFPWSVDERKIGEQFYLIVCSPEYKENPADKTDVSLLAKAYIQEEYSEDDVKEYLNNFLEEIGEIEIEDAANKLGKKLILNKVEWQPEVN
jgi:hypothetical protein